MHQPDIDGERRLLQPDQSQKKRYEEFTLATLLTRDSAVNQ